MDTRPAYCFSACQKYLACFHALFFVGTITENEKNLFRIRFPPQFVEDKKVDYHHATEEELTHALNLFKTVIKSKNLKNSNTDDKVAIIIMLAIQSFYLTTTMHMLSCMTF